jgi:hypothetical protein
VEPAAAGGIGVVPTDLRFGGGGAHGAEATATAQGLLRRLGP